MVPYTTGAATWTTSGSGVGSTIAITSVSSGQITGVSFTPGSGFAVSDLIYVTQGSATGAILEVTSVTTNTTTGLTYVSGGPTITPYTTGVPTWTTSGGGTGAAFNITAVTSGQVSGISVTNGGTGFNPGNTINLTQGSATGAVLTVATVSGTTILTVNITTGGLTPYTTASNVSTTSSGSGTGAKINITGVTSGSINSGGWNLAAGGSGYTVGDHIFPAQGAASGASFTVASVASNGILTINIDASGVTPYTTGTGVATNTSGSGTGMTINITGVTSGSINSGGWSLNSGGTGYSVGDRIYPAQGSASGAVFIVASISSSTGPIASFSTTNGGTGYVSATGLATSTSGAGTGATVTLSVGDELFFPPTSTSDIPNIFSGGNPISDSRTNAQVAWSTVGNTTIDGSAVWTNRGPSTDGGIVFNWGMPGGTSAPTVVVNNPSSEWAANTYYNQWQFIIATIDGNNYIQQVATSGLSGVAAPWNSTSKTAGQYTKDGTAEWVCLGNDGDTSLAWTPETKYSVGHVLEETVSSLSCVFRLQPYSGITTQGPIPAYCWNTGGQATNIDFGQPAQLAGNTPMAHDGGQTTSTADYTGTMNCLYLTTGPSGTLTNLSTPTILGDGSFAGAPGATSVTQLFPTGKLCSVAMFPVFNIPAAGTYTFILGHQPHTFWGIGSGSLNVNITEIQVKSGVLTATSDSSLVDKLSIGTTLTFSGLTSASFLNSQTISVTSVSGNDVYSRFFYV